MANFDMVAADLAIKHDLAQASAIRSKGKAVDGANELMKGHLYPTLSELKAMLSQNEDTYSLEELRGKIDFDRLNDEYMTYRSAFIKETENGEDAVQGKIDAGNIERLFPEDLSDISMHQLKKIEGQLEHMLDHNKQVITQVTQDLYLMIQIGVALLSSFQKAQEDIISGKRHIVRNQVR